MSRLQSVIGAARASLSLAGRASLERDGELQHVFEGVDAGDAISAQIDRVRDVVLVRVPAGDGCPDADQGDGTRLPRSSAQEPIFELEFDAREEEVLTEHCANRQVSIPSSRRQFSR